jgi:hypothetical protein
LPKQLETALINHKTVLIDLGDNQELLLKWDKEVSNYRGFSKKLGVEIGIWDLKYLLKIANGETKYRLVLINE